MDSKKPSIDIENNFAPKLVMRDKKKVVSELTECSKRCSIVYLVSDLDRVCESIAWHISETHTEKIKGLFEITKKAIYVKSKIREK